MLVPHLRYPDILNTFYTTIALILQLLSSPMLAEKYTLNRMGEIRFACVVVSGLCGRL